ITRMGNGGLWGPPLVGRISYGAAGGGVGLRRAFGEISGVSPHTHSCKDAAMSRSNRSTRRAPIGVAANAKPRAERGRTAAPETPLAVRAKDVEVDAELREYVAKRAGFKLGKFANAIERITVRFEDLNGPKKGSPADRC